MINSPLNYIGNKYKLLPQLLPLLAKDYNYFVDVFAGSGLVGLNYNANNIILNDYNIRTTQLLRYFALNDPETIIDDIEKIILKYGFTDTNKNGNKFYKIDKNEGLSKFNKAAFYKLRADYNKDLSIDKLFALIIYGFNHYMRFNSKDEYNVPIGKGDFSESLRKKTVEYSNIFKTKKVKITNLDFRSKKLYSNKKAFYYFDPPYLITQAPYNNMWTEEDEKDLLILLDELNKKGIKFALSNVITANGKKNAVLGEWMKKYNVHYLNRKYLNSNYRKKNITVAQEILVTNY